MADKVSLVFSVMGQQGPNRARHLVRQSDDDHVWDRFCSALVGFTRQFGRDFGDSPADFLDFFFPSGSFHVADDGLRGEHRRAKQVDFRFGSGPFTALQGFHHELYHQSVGRHFALLGLIFNSFPLFGRNSDVLLYRLDHPFRRSCREDFHPFRSQNDRKILVSCTKHTRLGPKNDTRHAVP